MSSDLVKITRLQVVEPTGPPATKRLARVWELILYGQRDHTEWSVLLQKGSFRLMCPREP